MNPQDSYDSAISTKSVLGLNSFNNPYISSRRQKLTVVPFRSETGRTMTDVAEGGPAEPQARHIIYCGGGCSSTPEIVAERSDLVLGES